MRDTIFARSSGPGRAGVAVFRISGPRAGEVLDTYCGGRGQPRKAKLVDIKLDDGSLLDRGLTLWFPGPASFTGDDVAELHLHGSIAVDRAFSRAMIDAGLTPAPAGAFTLRAFEAGKLDLSQAEGLADLLDAETEAQRRQALGQLGGRLSAIADTWRREILTILADLEAAIDFPDEEDIPGGIADRANAKIATLAEDMETALSQADQARAVREGITVVITGPPNVGKSSLLNKLLGENRAIVSPEAGTTRDTIEVRLEVAGQLVTIIDTAGLREGAGAIEAQGIERARRAAATADLRIIMAEQGDSVGPVTAGRTTLHVLNKTDRGGTIPSGWIGLSVETGEGWNVFHVKLSECLESAGGGTLTRERHVMLVEHAVGAIQKIPRDAGPEVRAEILRQALRPLDELVGRIAPDEILGEIFASFCIGK